MQENECIKELSFDLWGTLILSNPHFRPNWISVIQEYCQLSYDEVSNIINNLKYEYNIKAEKRGEGFSNQQVFESLAKMIGSANSSQLLAAAYTELFQRYPPLPAESHLASTLQTLSSKFRLHLNSNTVFASGTLLRTVLQMDNLPFYTFFSSFTFSDEVGFSKPSSEIFKQSYLNMIAPKRQVLHIGDNPVTDYQGAHDFGFQSILLTNKPNPKFQNSVSSIRSLSEII